MYDEENYDAPTDEERCAAGGHQSYGVQDGFFRCYCGAWSQAVDA